MTTHIIDIYMPMQSGKTTLAQRLGQVPNDLERPDALMVFPNPRQLQWFEKMRPIPKGTGVYYCTTVGALLTGWDMYLHFIPRIAVIDDCELARAGDIERLTAMLKQKQETHFPDRACQIIRFWGEQ